MRECPYCRKPLGLTEVTCPHCHMPVSPDYPTPSELAAQTTKSLRKILARSPGSYNQEEREHSLAS